MGDVDCSLEAEDCRDKDVANKLKGAALAAILLASALGVLMPILGKRVRYFRPEGDVFFVTKAFAAGVILATAFIHMLPDAMETLTNPCLPGKPWAEFPFAGFFAMLAALFTLVVDFGGTQYYERKHLQAQGASNPVAAAQQPDVEIHHSQDLKSAEEARAVDRDEGHLHIVDMHSHTHRQVVPVDSSDHESDAMIAQVRHMVISQVLELGIVAHSVIVGITLGVSNSPCSIRPLIAALVFHQFFEGIALGGCIVQAGFKSFSTGLMAFFFAITTPLGIAIGFGIQNSYNENSPKALIVQGIFDSLSAGILTYMSLVDLIAADFLSKRLRSNFQLQLSAYTALFAGAGAMSLVGRWA